MHSLKVYSNALFIWLITSIIFLKHVTTIISQQLSELFLNMFFQPFFNALVDHMVQTHHYLFMGVLWHLCHSILLMFYGILLLVFHFIGIFTLIFWTVFFIVFLLILLISTYFFIIYPSFSTIIYSLYCSTLFLRFIHQRRVHMLLINNCLLYFNCWTFCFKTSPIFQCKCLVHVTHSGLSFIGVLAALIS